MPATGPHRDLIIEALIITEDLPVTEASLAFHREVFGDGEVTFSDYERAVHAAAECVRELGYEIEGPLTYDEGGPIAVFPGSDPTNQLSFQAVNAPDLFLADSEDCQAIWQWRVEDVWHRLIEPTEQEIQIWLEALWECARELGIPLSDPPDYSADSSAIPIGPGGCEPWTAVPSR